MTTPAEVLEAAKVILLDFDGPMAQLMPPPLNGQAAQVVRDALGTECPPELQQCTDHITLLRHPSPEQRTRIAAETAATEFEIACATNCRAAPWIGDFLNWLESTRRRAAIVTNNSTSAVNAFLSRSDIGRASIPVFGRTFEDIDRLKPHPRLLLQAVAHMHSEATDSILIGDSVTDVQAGNAANIKTIGYAKNPARAAELSAAGALTNIMRNQAQQTLLALPRRPANSHRFR